MNGHTIYTPLITYGQEKNIYFSKKKNTPFIILAKFFLYILVKFSLALSHMVMNDHTIYTPLILLLNEIHTLLHSRDRTCSIYYASREANRCAHMLTHYTMRALSSCLRPIWNV